MSFYCLDNDIILKLATCNLFDDTIKTFRIDTTQVKILDTFKYKFDRQIKRKRGNRANNTSQFNIEIALQITETYATISELDMESSNLRTKLLSEINLIPEDKLEELYNFIHYFRVGVEASKDTPEKIMQFAGCWNDMSDETFADFSEEIIARRQQAFLERRSDETSLG